MKHYFFLLMICGLLLSLPADAQTSLASAGVKTFTGKNISFDYPADWSLVDKTAGKIQQFNIYPSKGNVLIMVVAYQSSDNDGTTLSQLKAQIAKPRISSVADSFTNPGKDEICYGASESRVSGLRLSGLHGTEESTADSYSFFLDNKYINLVYLKENKDNDMAEAAWKLVFDSLRVKHKISDPKALSLDVHSNNNLNGQALSLPQPKVSGGYDGTVTIEVTVDESGNVIAARGIRGDQFRFPASIAAAKMAKFTPTRFCGEYIKVTGYITYKFIRRYDGLD